MPKSRAVDAWVRQRKKEAHMRFLTRFLPAAAVVVAWHLSVPAANAQTSSPAPNSSDQSTKDQSANVSDQKLDAAAAALQRVVHLKADYQHRIDSAPASDQQRLAEEGGNALKKAVTDQGLSVEEYSSILTVAQNDPDVRRKILQRIHPADGE
jgi:predicted ATPase with chaperone activity